MDTIQTLSPKPEAAKNPEPRSSLAALEPMHSNSVFFAPQRRPHIGNLGAQVYYDLGTWTHIYPKYP